MFFLLTAVIFSFFSCELFNYEEPVREFFEYYTAAVTINTETYGVSFGNNHFGSKSSDSEFVGENGTICVPPGESVFVNFYLENPHKLQFELGSTILVELPEGTDEYEVSMDSRDPGWQTISLYFPESTVTEGKDLSPHVTVIHPETKVNFGTFTKLSLVCNTRPPAVDSPAVYIDDSTDEYVIFFNAPDSSILKEDAIPFRHKISLGERNENSRND